MTLGSKPKGPNPEGTKDNSLLHNRLKTLSPDPKSYIGFILGFDWVYIGFMLGSYWAYTPKAAVEFSFRGHGRLQWFRAQCS